MRAPAKEPAVLALSPLKSRNVKSPERKKCRIIIQLNARSNGRIIKRILSG
ncbi:MAG: hypothetical protein HZB54_09870 [Deltaproteobacteria bacterium]|nr:hypothetical protein [Deltaproteobacteria bacterium]